MKRIKTVDFWVQVILMFSAIVLIVKGWEYFIFSYLIVGGWQLLSMIVHEINKWFVSSHSQRRVYHNIAYIAVLIILATSLVPALFVFYYIMFLAAPVIAFYYTSLCYNETFKLLRRPLSQLK